MRHRIIFEVTFDDGSWSDDSPKHIADALGDVLMQALIAFVNFGSLDDPSVSATIASLNDETGAEP